MRVGKPENSHLDGMSLFNLRRRQIDVDKQMPVVYGDIPEGELEVSHTRGTVEVNVSRMPADERGEVHLREILGNAKSGTVEAIPTPHMSLVPGWLEDTDHFPLNTPSHYIRWSDIESNIGRVEYDLDEEDEAWLQQLAKEKGVELSEDDFEYLIDFLEKQEYLYPMIKLKLDKAVKEVRPELQNELLLVHEYWQTKVASRGGRPLLRRFLNHGNEKVPYMAFAEKLAPQMQPPKKQKSSQSGATIEDSRAVARLLYVRSQFVQMRLILQRVLQREEMKRERVRMTQHVLELIIRLKDPKSQSASLLASCPLNHYAPLASIAAVHAHSNGVVTTGANGFSAKSHLLPTGHPQQHAASAAHPKAATPKQGSRVVLKTTGARAATASANATSASSGTPPALPAHAPPSNSPRLIIAGSSSARGAASGSPARSGASGTPTPPVGATTAAAAEQPAKVLVPDPARLEGEYALNPCNLLRAYPFIGGDQRKLAEDKQHSAARARQSAEPQKSAAPFSSSKNSPFFDPVLGQRYDSLGPPDDDELLALEELEMEGEEDEEDGLLQQVQATIDHLHSALPPSSYINENGICVYQPVTFIHPETDMVYDPTDALVRWNKQDVSFLRKEYLESTQSPYGLPSFASELPGSSSHPNQTALPHAGSVPLPPLAAARNAAQNQRGAKRQYYAMPIVEPQVLPETKPGFHVYFARPSVNGNLPPRRFQVKTQITRGTVNNLPYTSWMNVCDVPVSAFGAISEADFSKRPVNHDDFNQVEGSRDDQRDKELEETPRKRYKMANGSMGFYSVDAATLAESLPETVYSFTGQSSYHVVDLNREGLEPFRGRKRIARFGRIVWDRVPNNALDIGPPPTQLHKQVQHRSKPGIENSTSIANDGNAQTSSNLISASSMALTTNDVPSTAQISAPIKLELGEKVESSGSLAMHASQNPTSPVRGTHPSSEASSTDLGSILLGSMTTTTTSPEPPSADAISGETTIAYSSTVHSPHEGSSSPNSKPDISTVMNTEPSTATVFQNSHPFSFADVSMMDIPLSENLEDMPWL